MAITQRLSLEEFLALPEEEPALELEPDGTVVQKVSPQGQHSILQSTLCERINHFARRRRIAVALSELRGIYGGAAYVPDVSVYRWERIPRTPEGKVANRFELPPDVAIEIVSPDQSPNRLVRRCLWYVDHGAERALLVDPADESVLQFAAGLPPKAVAADEPIDFGTALPDFKLTAAELFDPLRLDQETM
jgi:Uma2 family endonuclease